MVSLEDYSLLSSMPLVYDLFSDAVGLSRGCLGLKKKEKIVCILLFFKNGSCMR